MTGLASSTRADQLVPGDVAVVRSEADLLNARSCDYDELDGALRTSAMRADWSGRAADAFADCVTALRKRVQRASDDFARGSSAVAMFSHTLEWGQGEAQRALELWRTADAAERSSGFPPSPLADPLTSRLVPAESSDKRRARLILSDAVEAVDAAERAAVAALRELAASVPRPFFPASPTGTAAATTGGTGLLAALTALYGPNLGLFLAHHPDLAAELAALGAPTIARWWATLSDAQRAELIRRIPVVIGTTEGIPYRDRDAANVSRLRELLAAADHEWTRCLSERDAIGAKAAEDRVKALTFLVERFAGGQGPGREPPELLIALDTSTTGLPLASIVVGEIDTATTVNWYVPGMNSSLLEAQNHLRAVTSLNFRDPASATVLFLGYESPKLPTLDVLGEARARAGGANLADALTGYNAVRDQAGVDSQLNVIGHSYGTTTVAYGLDGRDLRVDNVIFVGSAGIDPSISAAGLNAHGGVYATEARQDHVADVGRTTGRIDPTQPGFGATTFSSDGAVLPDGTVLEAVTGHNAIGGSERDDHNHYFGRKTETMRRIRDILHDQRSFG